MTNRQRISDAIRSTATKRLLDEIDYYLDTYSDVVGYEQADALNDAMNFAECSGDRGMARDCLTVLIAAGYYQPRRGEVVIMGRDSSPIRRGVRYDCVAAWCEWVDG